MGNTSSTGKDKKLGLPNQAARSIQADDSDDEAAHAAGQPIVESAAPQPKNPLQIAEIANLVAKHVPENSKSALAAASTLFRDATQGPRIAHKCALLASQGEEEKIIQLFKISPSHIRYVIAKADIEDPTGRKMHCSAIQYALWAGDWHMWDMMLKALDKAEETALTKDQIKSIVHKKLGASTQADFERVVRAQFKPKTIENDSVFFERVLQEQFAEARRHKPYFGLLTQEEIVAIRAELFEQYKEVVDKGLDYTRTRYDRVQDATGKYQLINPRTVQVRDETHFDLKGPEFCLMPQTPDFTPEKGKLYARIEDGTLHYQVIALSGEPVKDSIDLATLQCPLVQLDNPDQLKPYIHKILKKTSERDHTHPQALISAFETYCYGLDNNWNDAQLIQQWCGGVGMAERFEATAVVGQEMCRGDVLLHVDRGQFKEPRFPRTLKFYNYLSTNADKYDAWVSSVGQTRLGLDFGIVNWATWGERGAACQVDGGGDTTRWPATNSAALSALCAVRTIDIAKLRDKLDPANLRDVAIDQGPRLE